MATEINVQGRNALRHELEKFARDEEVWRDGQGVYYVGGDVEDNPNYQGCVYQGTVAEVIGELAE